MVIRLKHAAVGWIPEAHPPVLPGRSEQGKPGIERESDHGTRMLTQLGGLTSLSEEGPHPNCGVVAARGQEGLRGIPRHCAHPAGMRAFG